MRERKSLVVVTGEDDWAEVHWFDPEEVRTPEAIGQQVSLLRPGPGEMSSKAWAREGRLGRPPLLDSLDQRKLERLSAMSGSSTSTVYDADYSREEGRVFVVDADVDFSAQPLPRVDWDSAVPHAATDPMSITWHEPVVRTDLAIIDPKALDAGRHRLMVDHEGVRVPFNEHGFEVLDLDTEDWQSYEGAVLSGERDQTLPNRGLMAITVYDKTFDDRPRVRTETLETLMARGTVPERDDCPNGIRSVDVEALSRAVGPQFSVIYDDNGERLGAMYVVEAHYGNELPGGRRVTDVLSASKAEGFDGMDIGGPGGPVFRRGTSMEEQRGRSLFVGDEAGYQPVRSRLGQQRRGEHAPWGGERSQPVAGAGRQRNDQFSPSGAGVGVPLGTAGSVSASRLAARRAAGLAGRAASTTVDSVRKHGPTAMAKVSEQLAKNPELTQMAKAAAVQAASSMVVAKTGANPQTVKKVADRLAGPSL